MNSAVWRVVELVVTVIVAVGAFGVGLALMNVRDTLVLFLGGALCLLALIAAVMRVPVLVRRMMTAKDVEASR